MITRTISITAVAKLELDPEELPDDVSDASEAIDAIKDELTDQSIDIDVGDYGDLTFTITKVEDTKPEPAA